MGSHMKRSIFDEQTSKALKNWHKAAKKKQGAATRVLGQSPVGSLAALAPLYRAMRWARQTIKLIRLRPCGI